MKNIQCICDFINMSNYFHLKSTIQEVQHWCDCFNEIYIDDHSYYDLALS